MFTTTTTDKIYYIILGIGIIIIIKTARKSLEKRVYTGCPTEI